MNARDRNTPVTETCLMVATIGMIFTALSTALAVFIASGALDGIDRYLVTAMRSAAIALGSLCLLAAVAAVAIFFMRTRRATETRRRPRPGGQARTT